MSLVRLLLRTFTLSAVEVSMRGPHQYISASEWPLMIVSLENHSFTWPFPFLNFVAHFLCTSETQFVHPHCMYCNIHVFYVILPSVLHGDVHHLRAVGCALASSLCLLLERPVADPVLDRRRYFPWHAREGGLLCRVSEHPL